MSSSVSGTSSVSVSTGQIVNIITWILLITAALSVFARSLTKYAVTKRLWNDDFLAIAALLCYIGSGVAVSLMDDNGLGVDITDIATDQQHSFEKSLFANELLLIATLCFAKLSMVLLFSFISQQKVHKRANQFIGCGIALWSTVSFIAAALSCRTSSAVNELSTCTDKAVFWFAFGIINILIDLILIAVPLWILLPLQMRRARKLMLMGCFGIRFVDVVATILQLVYTDAFRSPDYTEQLWRWTLICQFVQCVTIISSCIPILKPLLEAFPSGLFTSDELSRKGFTKTEESLGGSASSVSDDSARLPSHTARDSQSSSGSTFIVNSPFTTVKSPLASTTISANEGKSVCADTDDLEGARWEHKLHIMKTTTYSVRRSS